LRQLRDALLLLLLILKYTPLQLRDALGAKERQFGAVIKIGRTHMQVRMLLVLVLLAVVVLLLLLPPMLLTPSSQDATPITLGRCSRDTARNSTTASGGLRLRCRRCAPWPSAAPLSGRASTRRRARRRPSLR